MKKGAVETLLHYSNILKYTPYTEEYCFTSQKLPLPKVYEKEEFAKKFSNRFC